MQENWSYDVFLSFRGKDVRKNFLSHLYSALDQVGFRIYKDDNELQRGQEIGPGLLQAIEQSRIAVVVFSKDYADSGWCLDELVKILECRQNLGQIVVPVFYHVDPSDVRYGTGSFGDAFSRQRKKAKVASEEKVESWKSALSVAASLAGFHLEAADWDESELIKKIIEDIWVKIYPTYLSDVDHLCGIDSQVQNLVSLLSIDSEDVRFIGIHGMPGVGKTTIAKVARNQLFPRFDGNSFLEDVRLASKQRDGLVELQKRLLFDILKLKELHVTNVDDGIHKIKSRLPYKRVLIILDNVDHLDQLAALAKEHSWFGIGSRIIVTSGDEHLLNAQRVDAKYMVLPLPYEDASRLFCWHAFRLDYPADNHEELSRQVINYSGGLPLALKVLGSFLSDKTIPEWISTLEAIKATPHEEIIMRLRIIFDSLNDHQKAIFLDIAFFFVGMDENDVISILDGCGFHTRIAVRILIQKCLLTVSQNKVIMHDLLREMGKEIVHGEDPDEPGKRSRLWFYKDARRVLKYHEGSEKIRGLTGNFPQLREKSFRTEAFMSMKKLRLLQLRNACFVGGCENFSTELRWLSWDGFPWKSLPASLNLKKLVVLELRYSQLEQIWEQTKVLKNLKVLDLSYSHNLIRISDISGFCNIEKIILVDCINLIEVHQSIGNLSRLISLNLENCKSLVLLPTNICKLNSLEKLNLYLCSNMEELPEDLGVMTSLKELNISSTAIKMIPRSMMHLKNLTEFIWNNEGSPRESPCIDSLSPVWSLASVNNLNLSFCNLSDDSFPADLGGLPNLENLVLTGNAFKNLPTCLLHLPKLEELNLSECDLSGTESPATAVSLPSLQYLHLSKNNFCCLPVDLSCLPIQFLDVEECRNLHTISGVKESLCLSAQNCASLKKVGNKWETNYSAQLSEMESAFDRITKEKGFRGCSRLGELEGLFKLEPLNSGELAEVERLFKLESLENKTVHLHNDLTGATMRGPVQALSEGCIYSIFIPSSELPDWFNYQKKGDTIVVDVPQHLNQRLEMFVICAVYAKEEWVPNKTVGVHLSPTACIWIKNLVSGNSFTYRPTIFLCLEKSTEVMWVSCWRPMGLVKEGDKFIVQVGAGHNYKYKVKTIGVRLIYEPQNTDTLAIQASCQNRFFNSM